MICSLCGIERNQLHRDHIIPKYAGGPDVDENIQMICANCHEDKTIADRYTYPYRHSDETKEKIGRAHRGRTWSESQKANLAAVLRARPVSPRLAEAAKKANTGRKHTAEHRAKIAAARIRNPYRHPPEVLLKVTAARRGRERQRVAAALQNIKAITQVAA